MSFGIGVGDILMLSGLAYSIGKALTSGRAGALAEFHEVQNQLFAISNALKLLSTTIHGSGSSRQVHAPTLEDETLIQMVENCSTTLKHLEKVLEKYPELRPESGSAEGDEKTRRKWKEALRENIKKIKWTTEGADLDKLRHNLAIHINALNLAIAARGCAQSSDIKAQVDLTHGMLQDIHEWYLRHLKDSPKQQEKIVQTTSRVTEISIESEKKADESELKFSVRLEGPRSSSLCPKVSFDEEWLSNGNRQMFHCMCGSNHELDYTLLPVSLIVRLATSRPIWKIHAFSKANNSIVTILLDNVPSTSLSNFEHYISKLALLQGLRAASTAVNSMLMYTSMQEESQGSLSTLRTTGETLGFQHDFKTVTITSNGLRFNVDFIDSVQLLHYMSILFPASLEATRLGSQGELLPSRNAEMVIHTKTSNFNANNTDIAQLVLQFDHLTVIDVLGSSPSILLKAVNVKATLENNEDHNIFSADIELAFTSLGAAKSCIDAIKSLQQHVFLAYLQHQCRGEIIQFQRYVGDVMIRDMHLIDAQATVVQDLTIKEQRMIMKSKCGSKSVTMILPPASSATILWEESWTAPDLPAYFVDISPEETRIVRQSCGNILTLGLPLTEGVGLISDARPM